MRTEYRTITKRARTLLQRREGLSVDFKSSGDLSSEDLVAFANSDTGGAILLGVEEITLDGEQRGRVVGCRIDDKAVQRLTAKASSCHPPVSIQVVAENTSRRPFLRVEIASGPSKPYSTGGGTYKVRADGHNRPILPREMLAMFLEFEEAAFVDRFKAASDTVIEFLELSNTMMVKNLMTSTRVISEDMDRVVDRVRETETAIRGKLGEVFDWAEKAGSLSDEAMNYSQMAFESSENAIHGIDELLRRLTELDARVSTLLDHQGVEDPAVRADRVAFQWMLREINEHRPEHLHENLDRLIEDAAGSLYSVTLVRSWADSVLDGEA